MGTHDVLHAENDGRRAEHDVQQQRYKRPSAKRTGLLRTLLVRLGRGLGELAGAKPGSGSAAWRRRRRRGLVEVGPSRGRGGRHSFSDRLGRRLGGCKRGVLRVFQRVVCGVARLLQGLQDTRPLVARGLASLPAFVALVHAPFPCVDITFIFVWPDILERFVRAVRLVFRIADSRIVAHVLLEVEQGLGRVVVVSSFQLGHVLFPELLGSEFGLVARRRVTGSRGQ
eukprot:5355464-Pleurochrysis_carterae.AAC.2